jgi:CRP-like cAMP-binding protein
LKHFNNRVSPVGKEIIIDIIGPGEIFGELAIVDKNVERDEIAQALDDVLICATNGYVHPQ